MPSLPDHLAIREVADRFGVRVVEGVLHIEQVALTTIADELGTPVFVYGAGAIRERHRRLAEALAGARATVCYAVKANSSQAILRLLARAGAGADIVSGGELRRALAAGFDAERIVFSGVGKRGEEIDAALLARVRAINVESEEEVDHIARRARALGVRARIALRVNPDVDPATHPYLATGLREAKFGIPFGRAAELALRVAGAEELDLVGVGCHIGSQVAEIQPFLASLERLRVLVDRLAGQGVRLRHLDLGGGLAIPYRIDDPAPDIAVWGREIAGAMSGLGVELLLEPGRALVGNAGVLLTRVVVRKRGEARDFVVVDAAMNDLLRPALYGAHHVIVPVELGDPDREVRTVDVVGPVCESGDFLARERAMPWPDAGELWAVLGAGAYAMTMASTYNTRPLAAEVLVDGARWAVIRPRRSVEDLIADERMPEWLSD